MATFFEVKQLLCRMFGYRDSIDNENDVIIDIRNGRYNSERQGDLGQLVINNDELLELYNDIVSSQVENMELFSENEYEIAIDLDYPMMRRQEYPITSHDTINDISYELGFPTLRYCVFLLISIRDAQPERARAMLPMRLHRPMDFLRYVDRDDDDITWEKILPRMMCGLSLKIISARPKDIEEFRTHKTSFIFNFMYRSGTALVEFSDVVDMFRMNNTGRDRVDVSSVDTPPLREYSNDVVDYYKLALSSNDPYIKYISFYHIIEYFFDEVFKKKMVNDLKSRITHPDFSYKNEEKVYEIALFVKNRLRMNDESGQGNELESLKYVLAEYVFVDDLKNRLDNTVPDAVQYYQSSKVSFCNAPTISWSDLQGVYTQMAKRIYYTRNSLVHSKSGKNQERYKPYRDEVLLQKEIPLVKAVAEQIIINSSSML